MELTGKCKKEFENWYLFEYRNRPTYYFYTYGGKIQVNFYERTIEFKIGVYQLYFDSVGMMVEPYCNASGYTYAITKSGMNGTDIFMCDNNFASLREVWKQALEKANEIRNEQLLDKDLYKGNLGTDEYPEPNM